MDIGVSRSNRSDKLNGKEIVEVKTNMTVARIYGEF